MAASGGGGGGAGVRAGKAFVEMSAKDAGLTSTLDRMSRKVTSFGKATMGLGAAMAGIGGATLGAGFMGVMESLEKMGKMESIARGFQITSEAASGLFGMLEMNGGAFKENLEGMTQFGQRINDALSGVGGETGEAAKLFKGLSVQAKDLIGLPLDEQFYRVHAAVMELNDGLAKQGKLALIGGTDSAKQWQMLLGKSTDQLREEAKAAEMTSEDMNTARTAAMAYQKATLSLTMAWRQVAVAVAPAITQMSEFLLPMFKELAGWIKANKSLVTGLAAGLVAFTATGAALFVVGAAITAIGVAIALVGKIAAIVFTPAGLGIAAIVALIAITGTIPTMMAGVGEAFAGVGEDFKTTWGSIQNALSGGDMEGAWKALTAGLEVVWARFLHAIQIAWTNFKKQWVDSFKDFGSDIGLILGLEDFDARGKQRAADAASRAAALAETQAAIKEKQDAMDAVAWENKANSIANAMVAAIGKAAVKSGGRPDLQSVMNAIASRGTFMGAGASQTLGVGGTLNKIEANTKETADNTKKLGGEFTE